MHTYGSSNKGGEKKPKQKKANPSRKEIKYAP